MKQVNDCVLNILQVAAERQTAHAPARKDAQGAERPSFQKLLESKAEATHTEGQAAAAEGQENAEMISGKPLGVGDEDTELDLQNQMVWAALMSLQHPVVAMELAQQAPQAEPLVVLAEDQPILDPVACAAPMPEATPETAGHDLPLLEQKLLPNEANEAALQTTVMKPVEKDPTVVQHPSGETPLPDAAQPSEENMQRTEFGVEVPVFRDVPGLPVKVGEAPAVEQTGKELPVKAQLFERLSAAAERGETKVDIQLEPENLGHVQVEMTWSSDGTLRVSMYAESSQTQKLLERDLAGLQFLLSRNGQQEVSVEVTRQQEEARQDFSDGHPQGGQQERQPDHSHKQRRNGQDFLQQMRLGLIPLDEEVS